MPPAPRRASTTYWPKDSPIKRAMLSVHGPMFNAVNPGRDTLSIGRSVLGLRRVDLVDPREDAAAQVGRLLVAVLAEQRDRFRAAHARLAVDHDLARVGRRRQLGEPRRQLPEGHQRRTGDPADLELLRLADVEDERRRFRVEPRAQLLDRGLRPGR